MASLIDLLIRDEGFRATMYLDPLGHPTLGYGHNLNTPISQAAAEHILRDDVTAVYHQLMHQSWFFALSEARAAVVVSMAFNLGMGGLLTFTKMLDALRARNWEQAATEMLDSTWAHQVGARATRLAAMMRTDTWA